jgi:elongation factor P--(R)-beta-lysine ligase
MSRGRVVIAPSDALGVTRPPARPGALVHVGGRVLQIARGKLVVADAFAAIEVQCARRERVTIGDLVVVCGKLRRTRLHDARLVERQRCPAPPGNGELARLAFQNVGANLLARARALAAIRGYFASEAFIEVDTPVRVRTPGLDRHVDAVEAEGGFLVTSPEHHMKRLLVGGMPRIYQLARASRAGERGPLHEPEFLMLEWYRAFSGQDAVMADTEQIVRRVALAVSGRCDIVLGSGRRIDLEPPFERWTVRKAFRDLANVPDAARLAERDEDRFFQLLVGTVEPALAELSRPIFLCEYPIRQASLARPKPSDPSVAERFELYLAGVELCNGFGELTDPKLQRRRFRRDQAARRRAGRPVYSLDERLLQALEEGMPQSGGNALGVDRLIALACGVTEIGAVMPFPADRS